MSSSIPRSSTSNCSSGSESESDSDQDWDDWVQEDEGVDYQGSNGGLKLNNSDSKSKSSTAGGPRLPTLALFPDSNGDKQTFSSPAEAIQHARDNFGVDLLEVVNRCALDPLQVIRLLNHLRRSNSTLTPQSLKDLKGNENFLNDDQELKPVEGAEMDGLLQIDFDEMMSNQLSTEETSTNTVISTSDFIKNKKKISELESELKSTQSAFNELRRKYAESLGIGKSDSLDDSNTSTSKSTPTTSSNISKPSTQTSPVEVKRDDDTHYFDSYSSNEIHQVMISDSIRTLSYAKFILSPSNSHLFKDKVIMDVGCGSGILSMFAARAGAKKVLAIDASKVAEKAKENFRENELDHKIQIFNGKIEELKKELEIWEGKVDLIVSEWMGYFLLYESMLPSVLHARDLYLNKKTGILAPSHCRMTLALIQDQELIEDKIHFWKDVYGFKMNYMIKGCFDDAYTEVVEEDKLVSNVENIFDLPLQILDVKQPEFKSKFNLKVSKSSSNSELRSDGLIEIHAFISWFDTWFYPNPPAGNGDENDVKHPIPNNGRKVLKGGEILNGLTDCTTKLIEEKDVNGLDLKGNQILESGSKDGGGEIVSFTTGPQGKPTHWKQTLFLLKEPILAKAGTLVSGEIHVNQSDSNSRELDVEIHYSVKDEEEEEKGKKVTAQLVQLFKVR